MYKKDTIAAISSVSAEAAIAVVRMSGSHAERILSEVFVSKNAVDNRKMLYGHIVDPITGERVDEVMAVFLRAPATYTREDIAEIYCHGGSVAAKRVLDVLLASGARIAERGEFTLRAFLNGRIDLSQAESVLDLVKAKTPKAFDCALKQLDGASSSKLNVIKNILLEVVATITVALDYPEEDEEDVSWNFIRSSVKKAIEGIDDMLTNSEHSRLIREGAKVAIVGRPNAGKSSIMNLLLGETRSIVTEVAGTTRDTIEEAISIKGYPVRITDTAGIRETLDEVEKIGVERAKKAANEAEIVLYIIDASKGLDDEEKELLSYLEGRKAILVVNKIDLFSESVKENLKRELDKEFPILWESAVEDPDRATEQVREALYDMLKSGIESDDVIINERQKSLLKDMKKSLEDALESREYDLAEVDIRAALSCLGKITGDDVDKELLHTIFSKFCLGK